MNLTSYSCFKHIARNGHELLKSDHRFWSSLSTIESRHGFVHQMAMGRCFPTHWMNGSGISLHFSGHFPSTCIWHHDFPTDLNVSFKEMVSSGVKRGKKIPVA